MQQARCARLGEDKMIEKVQWRCLIEIDNASNFIRGEKSREKFIQLEREMSVNVQSFLSKEGLPESPSEPDPEQTILPPKSTGNVQD